MENKITKEFKRDQLDAIVKVIEDYQDNLQEESLEPSVRDFLEWYHTEVRE